MPYIGEGLRIIKT